MISRREVRQAIASLIRAQSTLAQAVYPYLPPDFAGSSPVITVTGAGSERPRITMRGVKTSFRLVVETFVLYSDPSATPPWTPEDAENTMDDLEADIAVIVANNPTGECWNALSYETVSAVSKVSIGGVAYLYEAIPLTAEVL